MKKTLYDVWIRYNTKMHTGTLLIGCMLWVWAIGVDPQNVLLRMILWILFIVNSTWSFFRNDDWFREEAKKLPENNK